MSLPLTEVDQFFFFFGANLVCYTAVFSVVTQRSSSGEERCVTTLKMAVQQTRANPVDVKTFFALDFMELTSVSFVLQLALSDQQSYLDQQLTSQGTSCSEKCLKHLPFQVRAFLSSAIMVSSSTWQQSVDISRAVYLIRCLLALTTNIHLSLTFDECLSENW